VLFLQGAGGEFGVFLVRDRHFRKKGQGEKGTRRNEEGTASGNVDLSAALYLFRKEGRRMEGGVRRQISRERTTHTEEEKKGVRLSWRRRALVRRQEGKFLTVGVRGIKLNPKVP